MAEHSYFCKGCKEQLGFPTPIRGPLNWPFRMFGLKPSKMNPNCCTMCEVAFKRAFRAKNVEVDTTILFADLRGYTTLSEELGSADITEILHDFYDQCTEAIWQQDGIINKFIGDAVMAVFNFPIAHEDHTERAIKAALSLQEQCRSHKKNLPKNLRDKFNIGIGLHAGKVTIGEVGTSFKDFTAIGPVVNLSARLQSKAKSGEIVMSQEVLNRGKDLRLKGKRRTTALKGLANKVTYYALGAA